MSLFDDASLVMIPDGAKDGTLYSVKPTDGTGDFTFTRGSNLAATRVDENGLIEKGRENLLLQSNSFSTSPWESNQVNREAVVSSGEAGYDGTNDAWLVLDTTGSGLHQISGETLSLSGIYNASVYAKAYTNSRYLGMAGFGLAGGNEMPVFDLVNGTIDMPSTSSILKDATITSVGNGWYRCSMMFSYSGSSSFSITLCDSATNNGLSGYTYTGTGSNGFYIQDAQLEVGLVATDYIETGATTAQAGILEDLPRIDYSGGASCPSLLLEPQRTNLITQSEYTDGYLKSNITTTSNQGISPEGVNNATEIETTSTIQCHLRATFTAATGNYTGSVFVKKQDFDYIYMELGGAYAWFNINTGGLGNSNAYGSDWTYVDHSIEDYGNGWYRCILVGNCVNAGSYTFRSIQPVNANGGYNSNLSGGITYLYGAQVEEGSYPTSYIPTYGSSVTRSGDVPTISSGSGIFNDSEGTFYAEIEGLSDTSSTKVITIGDGTSSNRLQIFYQLGTNITTNLISGGSSQVTGFTTAATQTDNNKVLIRYASNNAKMYLNGTEIASDTSVTPPSGLVVLRFNNGTGASLFEGQVKQLLYFPTALTDSECIALTTI